MWCCYEIFVSIGLEASAKQYDVYTARPHRFELRMGGKDLSEDREAVGICSRPAVFKGTTDDDKFNAELDKQFNGVEPARAQQEREQHFPLDLARSAFKLRLQDAKASVEADRVKILNTLAGRPPADRAKTPLPESDGYEELNDVLRGRLAASAIVPLFDKGDLQSVDECARLLRRADERRPAAPSLRGAALVRACGGRGREGCVRALLGVGAPVDHADASGNTPLMNACTHGDDLCARALIEAGAQVDHAANNGFTALMASCQEGHEPCARALIEEGASLEVVNV